MPAVWRRHETLLRMNPTELPHLTRDQMVEVDRLMIEEAGITLVQMMENAGRSLAAFIIDRFRPSLVVVLAGRGGNGGGGLVAARHLANRGVAVEVVLSADPVDFDGVPARQLFALSSTTAEQVAQPTGTPDVIVDALIGYSLTGAPRGRALHLIEWANGSDVPIVSLDVPSGLESTSGLTPGEAIAATAVLTLALPKIALANRDLVGELHLADISVPSRLYRHLGLDVPTDLFAESQVIQLS